MEVISIMALLLLLAAGAILWAAWRLTVTKHDPPMAVTGDAAYAWRHWRDTVRVLQDVVNLDDNSLIALPQALKAQAQLQIDKYFDSDRGPRPLDK